MDTSPPLLPSPTPDRLLLLGLTSQGLPRGVLGSPPTLGCLSAPTQLGLWVGLCVSLSIPGTSQLPSLSGAHPSMVIPAPGPRLRGLWMGM